MSKKRVKSGKRSATFGGNGSLELGVLNDVSGGRARLPFLNLWLTAFC